MKHFLLIIAVIMLVTGRKHRRRNLNELLYVD